jgi:hypothetical protein
MAKKTKSKKKADSVGVEINLPITRGGLKRVQKKVMQAIEAELGEVAGQDDYTTHGQCYGSYGMGYTMGT